jgi:hypothetical protein
MERKNQERAAERAEAESRATATLQARIAAEEALTRKALEAAAAEEAATRAAQERAEREEEMQLALSARAEADAQAADAAAQRARADGKALATLQKRIALEQKSEALANRRAEVESAAADVLRAGVAAEEVLETQTQRTGEAVARAGSLQQETRALKNLRPARRWPWIAAGAAVVGLTIAYGIFERTHPAQAPAPALEMPAGEPLKLKLEFAFPAARR